MFSKYLSIVDPSSLTLGIVTGVTCVVVYNTIVFYWNVRKYPKGPTPLPLLGNILSFRGPRHAHETMLSFAKVYGPVYTVWLGPLPQVQVTDPQLILEVLKSREFSGRPRFEFLEATLPPGSLDIVFVDSSKGWEVLRKVAVSAIRKYSIDKSLPLNVIPSVDEAIDNMRRDKVFYAIDHLSPMLSAIAASSAFGRRYPFADPELRQITEDMDYVTGSTMTIIFVEFLPLAKWFLRKAWNKLLECDSNLRKYGHAKYLQHVETFDDNRTRDFMDAMIHAKIESEREDSVNSKYLTPMNIVNSIRDLFIAGSDTTRYTMDWWFVLCANYPDMQDHMRREVEGVLSDHDMPSIAVRDQCPFTQAFIAEVLRFRHIIPGNLPHKAMEDVTIGGVTIPKGTQVMTFLHQTLLDKETWTDPEVFRPERFLDENGKFNPRPNTMYIPFSSGRRGCIGERLALSNMFLIVVRLFQKTRGYRFVLDGIEAGHAHLDGDIDNSRMFAAKPQKIRLEPSI